MTETARPQIDMTSCEHCGKEFPFEGACSTADGCYLCPACDAEWREIFASCAHDWDAEPAYDDMGDEGKYCRKCHGFVLVDQQEAVS